MRFAQPSFLIVAAVAALVLLGLMIVAGRARQRALGQLGAQHLIAGLTASLSSFRRHFKQALILGGVALLFVSLARPQWGYRWEEVHRRGIDLLFAVDTSKSMLTPDIKPNRLERAKLAVRDLVERFPDNRVGLVAFAGSAFLQTPLTLDHAIFDQSLDALDTSVIPLGGTDVASAIEAANKALSDEQREKVLVLLTDGEDLQGNALPAAEKAGKEGLVIDTVGVGTPRGELVPLPSNDGPPRFVRDEDGRFVTSHLDETLLRRIAQATGGVYRPLGDSGTGLESLYEDALSRLAQSDLAARSQRILIERYQWPLGLGLLLLAIEPLVGERRRKRVWQTRGGRPGQAFAVAAGAVALLLFPGAASASPQSAERAYRDGQYDRAEADYAKAQEASPSDARLSFDLGDAAYRKGDFDGAAKAFEATLQADDLKLQTKAYYNLGNARYRIGEHALAAKDVDGTIREWKQAVSHYEGAVALDGKDQDARDNLELVKRRLAELERQQDQKKQDQDKDKGQKNDKDKGQPNPQNGKGQPNPQNGKGQPNPSNPKKDGNAGPNGTSNATPPSGAKSTDPTTGQGPPAAPRQPGGEQFKSAQPARGVPEGAEERSAPGELSKQEARALLDSLRGDLAVLVRAPLGPKAPPTDETPRKDW